MKSNNASLRTSFPHLAILLTRSCGQKSVKKIKEKCRNTCILSSFGIVPRAGLEPARLCSHRILSPDNFPELPVESRFLHLHFGAKCDISAPYFRTLEFLQTPSSYKGLIVCCYPLNQSECLT